MHSIFSKLGLVLQFAYRGANECRKSFIDRLESSGLLTATSHIVVDLYGSLSLTGKGHATDVAIIMGLAGNSPQDVVIDEILHL